MKAKDFSVKTHDNVIQDGHDTVFLHIQYTCLVGMHPPLTALHHEGHVRERLLYDMCGWRYGDERRCIRVSARCKQAST